MTVFYEVTTYLDESVGSESRLWMLVDSHKPEFAVADRSLYLRLELRDTKLGKAHKRLA